MFLVILTVLLLGEVSYCQEEPQRRFGNQLARFLPNRQKCDIFYSPHQDDEALGMAGAICNAKKNGNKVVLVLITDGSNPDWCCFSKASRMNSACSGNKCTNNCLSESRSFTELDFVKGRTNEFKASAQRLGVDECIILWETGQDLDDSLVYTTNEDPATIEVKKTKFKERFKILVRKYERMYPGAHHHVASGTSDFALDNQGQPEKVDSVHVACAEAASELLSAREITNCTFHRIGIYNIYEPDNPREGQSRASKQGGPKIVPLDCDCRIKKVLALDEYKVCCPEHGRYAIGQYSVPPMLNNAATDPNEYIDNTNN